MENNELLLETPKLKVADTVKRKSAGLAGADGLRAIACLSVIFHHFAQRLAMNFQSLQVQELQAYFLLGNVGVSIFFVLSGFLLSYPFWKQYLSKGNFPDIKQYVLKRAARIIPGYYVSFLICTMIIILLHIQSDAFLIRIISGLTFTAGFHYVTFFPNEINAPFWSISFEVFCYILMPLFMFGLFKVLGRKRSFIKSFLYWIVVFALITYLNELVHIFFTPDNVNRGWEYGIIGGAKYWMPNYNPIGFFGHFAIGIMAAGISARLSQNSKRTEYFKKANRYDVIGIFCFIGSGVLLWNMRKLPDFSFSLQNQPYYFPAYTILIATTLAVTPQSNWFGKLLDNRFFRFTAKVSYGLYIWHYLIIILVSSLWIKYYQYMGMTNIKEWGCVSLVILLVSYAVSMLSFKFIEKPVLDWVQRRSFRKHKTR